MCNPIEYSSNYFEITGGLLFFSKDEATNFDADIAKNCNNNCKSFKYKAILSGNTKVQLNSNQANRTFEIAKIAVPLKH